MAIYEYGYDVIMLPRKFILMNISFIVFTMFRLTIQKCSYFYKIPYKSFQIENGIIRREGIKDIFEKIWNLIKVFY